eukprot:6201420-Pleurochrysis_carterae.AAC.2
MRGRSIHKKRITATSCTSRSALQCQVVAAAEDAILRSRGRHKSDRLYVLLMFIEMTNRRPTSCKIGVCDIIAVQTDYYSKWRGRLHDLCDALAGDVLITLLPYLE